jgi:exodeoxyribonuclease VII large subunit
MNVFSVAQFIEFVNAALTAAVFPEGVIVEGEVSAYRVSQGKWVWFDLKDKQAVISCFATAWQLRSPLEDGMQVRVYGSPRIYPKSGRFSISVERVEPVGEGALRRAFELLKKKLTDEGLFAPERKRRLPSFPSRLGLIASSGSAAYGDFMRILGDRWGGLTINLIDVAVQGKDAVQQIVSAFDVFNSRPELADVIVLTRGGGSLEDLQAFNTEEVARAVFGSRIPVVVGVGHERDSSLADFAADVRAATPTNAAEIVVPDRRQIAAAVDAAAGGMFSALKAVLSARSEALGRLSGRIDTGVTRVIAGFDDRLRRLDKAFGSFAVWTRQERSSVAGLGRRLIAAAGRLTVSLAGDIAAKERLLVGLDPRRLLARGFAVVRKNGRIVKDAGQVDIGEILDVQLHRGRLTTEVKKRSAVNS